VFINFRQVSVWPECALLLRLSFVASLLFYINNFYENVNKNQKKNAFVIIEHMRFARYFNTISQNYLRHHHYISTTRSGNHNTTAAIENFQKFFCSASDRRTGREHDTQDEETPLWSSIVEFHCGCQWMARKEIRDDWIMVENQS